MTTRNYGSPKNHMSLARLYLSKGVKPEQVVSYMKQFNYTIKGQYFYGTKIQAYMEVLVDLDILAKQGRLSATKAKGLVVKPAKV